MNKYISCIIIFSLFLSGACNAFGETLRLTNGRTIEGEILQETNTQIRFKTANDTLVIPLKMITARGDAVAAQENVQQEPVKIQVYLTNWCPYCQNFEKYLRRNKIAYERYNIDYDMMAKKRYKALGGTGIPFIVIDEFTMSGFDPSRFENLLHIAESRRARNQH